MKVTIMFRGREQSCPELGYRPLQRLGNDVAEYGFAETPPAGRSQHDDGAGPTQGRQDQGQGWSRSAVRDRSSRVRAAQHRPPSHISSSACATPPTTAAVPANENAPGDRRAFPFARMKGIFMPKSKTHKGTAKRFKVTGSGKIVRQKANRRHPGAQVLAPHSPSRRRRRRQRERRPRIKRPLNR